MNTIINWDDGTNDTICLTYNDNVENQNVSVSSEPNNTIQARSKTVTFQTITGGVATQQLDIEQQSRERSYSQGYGAAYK